MQIEGLIPFKSSIDQAMVSLYFLRIFNNYTSFSFVKSATMITGYALLAPKKTYFKCFSSFFIINPSELFSTPCSSSSLLLDFSILIFLRLSTVDECKTHLCFEFISHDILSI